MIDEVELGPPMKPGERITGISSYDVLLDATGPVNFSIVQYNAATGARITPLDGHRTGPNTLHIDLSPYLERLETDDARCAIVSIEAEAELGVVLTLKSPRRHFAVRPSRGGFTVLATFYRKDGQVRMKADGGEGWGNLDNIVSVIR